MMPRSVVLCALAAMLTATAWGQEARTVSFGPWTAAVDGTGLRSLQWQGEEIVQAGGMAAYLPGWAGGRFGIEGSELTVGESSATWHRDVPGNQVATMSLELSPERATLSLDTTIRTDGPTEFWAQIVPDTVYAAKQCFLWANDDQLHTLPRDETFEKIGGLRVLCFETPQRTVTIRCNGFELQDRRRSGSGLFLVSVIGSGDPPTSATRTIEFEVEPAPEGMVEAREAMYSQQALETTPVEFSNADFEQGLEGWSAGPTASIDEQIVHSGDRAARLDIEQEVARSGDVYITRQIPVRERGVYRASAWIRGENVESMTHQGMGPVGATIIIEFADRQGQWFASGDYAESNYETFDWRHVRTEAVQAPPGAGYAIIFLALRGAGTAWFDDVTLERVQHHVVLMEPLPGAEVYDNTPRLNWQFSRETWATVELSQDPSFPDDGTRRLERVSTPPVAVEEPLEPGTWHWRVVVPTYDVVSHAWSFEQTAPQDADTTEPEITGGHDWLATPRAPLRVRFSDNVGVERVRMIVDGRDVSDAVEMGEGSAIYRPDEPWADGLRLVEVRVEDAAGNAAEKTLFFTRADPPSRIVWQPVGGVTINGEPHFLLGMYGVNIEDMPEMAAAGFDYVHSYAWDGAGSLESALEYLDAAQRNGLRVFMGLSRQRLMAHDERFVAERVAALMEHPALFAWYLYDEPDLEHQYVSPMWLERYYRLLKSLDPFHPVVVTVARDQWVEAYADALDVHWTQVYGSTQFVADRIERHREALDEGTPVAAILHCYDRLQTSELRAGAEPDPEQFNPSGELMRANAFMALAHNSSGLTWWWWGYGGGDRYFTVANAPEEWASLKETIARIREIEPELTSDGVIARAVLTAEDGVDGPEGAEVHVWEKQLPGRVLAIAVNQSQEAVDLRWRPQMTPAGRVRVRWEGRTLEPADGTLVDSFEPLGVHVYEWPTPEM